MRAPGETRGMVSVPGRVVLGLLCVPVQLGVCHSVLDEVVALAGKAPGLSDEQMWAALGALGDRASRMLLEGETQ
jgi:hypothetical protein